MDKKELYRYTGDVSQVYGVRRVTYADGSARGMAAIEAETGAYEVADAECYDDILTVIVGDDAYMKEHPEYARQFLQAVLAATDWIKDNEEEAFSIVAEEMGDTSENIVLYYNTRTFEYELDAGVSDALDDTISYLYEQGTIKNRPDVADLTDASYLDAVRKEQP